MNFYLEISRVDYACIYIFQIKTGYSETITMFYMFAVSDAIAQTPNVMEISFEDFLKQNGHLLDRSLMYEYYSRDIISNPTSKTE